MFNKKGKFPMKKVGIITITGLGNYGNRLQNYALQQAIETLPSCQCETLNNRSSRMKSYIKNIIMPRHRELTPREQVFQKFNEEFMHFSEISINNISRDSRLLEYDCLVCGSDQIWNSDYPENDRANFGYIFPEMNVISYAASFGTDTVVKAKKRKYAKYLNHLSAISVREEKGKQLAEQLTGRRDVCVHVDPTLLLTAKEWMNIEKIPELYNGERYILKYFLGEKNSELNRKLEDFAKSNNLLIIDVISKDSPYYNIGPSEFLFLERNAELIVTDSFHSCVFAMLYERPFIVAERKEKNLQSMGSRIDTLLRKFQLENRRYIEGDIEDKLHVNYSHVNEILVHERDASTSYLKKWLDNK